MRNTSAPGGSEVKRIFTCFVVAGLGDFVRASRLASTGAGVVGSGAPDELGGAGDVAGGDALGCVALGCVALGCVADTGVGVVDDSVATVLVPCSRARSTPAVTATPPTMAA